MNESPVLEQLIECLIHVVGRAAMPEARVLEIVGNGPKQIKAFNLADGTRTQSEIARKARIDQGSLSRTAARWVECGVAFWIGNGKEARVMHIYQIPTAGSVKTSKTKDGRKKEQRR